MENQIFKNHMRELVKEYLDIDNEIITLQKAMKERMKASEAMDNNLTIKTGYKKGIIRIW